MITERSIKLLSSVMLISTNRIKVLRLWLTCFEDWKNQDFNICLVDVKNEKCNGLLAGVSFPPSSRAPRVFLAPKTPFPFPFKRLPRRLCRPEKINMRVTTSQYEIYLILSSQNSHLRSQNVFLQSIIYSTEKTIHWNKRHVCMR